MKKVIGLVIGLLPVSAFGECVPVPDCASIGYTETSCDGGSLKCPFDSSKLKCFPCDSSFRYSCDGANVKNPVGVACNNKYVACECTADTTFTNGECVCDTSCSVGNIYYSDGTCSSCIDEAKTPVGIVVKDGELVVNLVATQKKWSIGYKNIPLLNDYSVTDEVKEDYQGRNNTKIIVDYFGNNDETKEFAAHYCYNYAPENFESSQRRWYLPALGELYWYAYKNYAKINKTLSRLGISAWTNGGTWSSTEYVANDAWLITLHYGSIMKNYNAGKPSNANVICFIDIRL